MRSCNRWHQTHAQTISSWGVNISRCIIAAISQDQGGHLAPSLSHTALQAANSQREIKIDQECL